VDPERWLGRARAKTGVDFDLPTEAQWEFACRAGTSTDTYNGDFKKTNDDIDRVVKPIAWFDGSLGGMHWSPVGEKIPNAFGLYDMIGNGCEMCLDYYAEDYGGVTNKYEPEGPASGSDRTYRSCTGALSYLYATSAKRDNQNRTYYGTRLTCPVSLKYADREK
jgi:formylglycine-generating enzyme required for sulfatase activity